MKYVTDIWMFLTISIVSNLQPCFLLSLTSYLTMSIFLFQDMFFYWLEFT